MTTILEKIVTSKRNELQHLKKSVPIKRLEKEIARQDLPLNFSGALMGDNVRIIAEVKKASPSRGVLSRNFDPIHLSKTYAQNGAAAISVVTDMHFQGSINDLELVKSSISRYRLPVLRKDFIIDPYQVHQSRAAGADALLLIVAILSKERLQELLDLCQHYWMQALVEVHTIEELCTALDTGAEIIGINNRNLHTFDTDLSVTEEISVLIPKGKIIVSESGISTPDHIARLRPYNVNAVLVGEALVTADDINAKMNELVNSGDYGSGRSK